MREVTVAVVGQPRDLRAADVLRPRAAGVEDAAGRRVDRRRRLAADDDIAERARPGVTVFTSDRELAQRARAQGAAVEGARSLLDRL